MFATSTPMIAPLDSECHRQLTAFAGTAPRAIDYAPLAGHPIESYMCHKIVAEHVKHHGGKQIFGWMQGASAKDTHEFVFHSVWARSDGKLIDVTPNNDGKRRTVFAPDLKRRASPEQMDGYNNLFFVCTRAALTQFQQDWRTSLELKQLCWMSFLNTKPLSEKGKYQQVSQHVDELNNRYGLRVTLDDNKQYTVENLFDLSFNQLADVEYSYAIYLPGLDQALRTAWPQIRHQRDLPLKSLSP